jgi:hypothetical protein
VATADEARRRCCIGEQYHPPVFETLAPTGFVPKRKPGERGVLRPALG